MKQKNSLALLKNNFMDDRNQQAFKHLRSSRYFKNLPDTTLYKILELAKFKNFEKGEIILEQGEENSEVFILISGSVSVKVDGQFIYNLTRKGDIFGEISVITGEVSTATIQAHEDPEIITISLERLENLKKKSSQSLYHVFYQWTSYVLSAKLKRTSQKAKLYEDINDKLQHQKEQLEQYHNQMTLEMEQARNTQSIILPQTLPSIPGIRIACRYVSMDQIGGDFYDVLKLEEDQFGILIADVTGHGISAALLSFMVSNTFKNTAPGILSPVIVIKWINELLVNKLPKDKFVTLFYAIYDTTNQMLTYTNAGHPPALVFRPTTEEVFDLPSSGMMVGTLPNEITNYQERCIPLQSGDKVLFYTDGLVEVTNTENQMLGPEGLEKLLKTHKELPLENLLEQIYNHSFEYSTSTGFEDDVTMVGIEILKGVK